MQPSTPVNNNFRTQLDRTVFKKDVLDKTKLKNAKKAFKATVSDNYKPVVISIG